MAQLVPLPLTVSCFSKIQIGFAFLVPAHPGSPGKRAVLNGCSSSSVCLVVYIIFYSLTQGRLFSKMSMFLLAVFLVYRTTVVTHCISAIVYEDMDGY